MNMHPGSDSFRDKFRQLLTVEFSGSNDETLAQPVWRAANENILLRRAAYGQRKRPIGGPVPTGRAIICCTAANEHPRVELAVRYMTVHASHGGGIPCGERRRTGMSLREIHRTWPNNKVSIPPVKRWNELFLRGKTKCDTV